MMTLAVETKNAPVVGGRAPALAKAAHYRRVNLFAGGSRLSASRCAVPQFHTAPDRTLFMSFQRSVPLPARPSLLRRESLSTRV